MNTQDYQQLLNELQDLANEQETCNFEDDDAPVLDFSADFNLWDDRD